MAFAWLCCGRIRQYRYIIIHPFFFVLVSILSLLTSMLNKNKIIENKIKKWCSCIIFVFHFIVNRIALCNYSFIIVSHELILLVMNVLLLFMNVLLLVMNVLLLFMNVLLLVMNVLLLVMNVLLLVMNVLLLVMNVLLLLMNVLWLFDPSV